MSTFRRHPPDVDVDPVAARVRAAPAGPAPGEPPHLS
jgi:hypothetical protein